MFSEEVKYQLDFIKSSKIIPIIAHSDDVYFNTSFNKLKEVINRTKSKKISIVSFNETFKTIERIKVIEEILEKTDIEYYFSAATSSKMDKFFNPIVNIYFWKDTFTRNNVKWNLDNNSIKLFNESDFKIATNKVVNGILSIRKENNARNYLNTIIDKKSFNGWSNSLITSSSFCPKFCIR